MAHLLAPRRFLVACLILPGLLVAMIFSLACSSTSPTEGRWFGGDALVMSLLELIKTPELRYQGNDQNHYLITPTSPDNELVMVRLDIRNSKAAKTIFTVDNQAVELRWGAGVDQIVKPLDVEERSTLVERADPSESKFARNLPNCPQGSPCVRFLRGPVELAQNFQLAGWLVFEAPKGTTFTELRWSAGDTVIMRF